MNGDNMDIKDFENIRTIQKDFNRAHLTAIKVIEDMNVDLVMGNFCEDITQINKIGGFKSVARVMVWDNLIKIQLKDNGVPIAYYFADSFNQEDFKIILSKIRDFCRLEGIIFDKF